MAGSISLSLSQRYDKTTHEPLNGGKLWFYAAGTTTPQNAYQDVSLTIPWPNPLILDSGGNVPQLFFADGYIKFRLASATGATQIAADYVMVVGPSSGGGSAPSVDATTIMQPGDMKLRYGVGVIAGFVRANGRTIGNAASGASERANDDTDSLYEVLYADPNLAVSGGRGASMAADYAAGKAIALPDFRNRVPAGLGDMGNSDAGLFSLGYFAASGTTLGAKGGAEKSTLSTVNLPPYTPAGTVAVSNGTNVLKTGGQVLGGNGSSFIVPDGVVNIGAAFTGAAQGGTSEPVRTIQPTILITFYLKL